ncbi:PadR family transcriptional regulator [Dactylosporangium matsuzakiense]|nr:helix-turn-helix transcriptional regulator [Dactylosporangium matsuzakiense]UWZ43272.1 helix-turn-helix transcriptional regulator [Dactylosporangium matsuzakiense]
MDLRGHLDLLLLATLRRVGPVHAYALIAALRQGSDGAFDLPEGTVYPALHRLERDGLVDSEWSTDQPRRRRVYRLTDAGAAAVAVKRREWTVFERGVRAILGPGAVEGLA